MIEPISADLNSAMSGVLAEVPQGPAHTAAARIEDTLRFDEAMMAPPTGAETVNGVENRVAVGLESGEQWVLPQGTLTPAEPAAPTVGDRILNGMDTLRDGWSGVQHSISEAMSISDFTPADMLRLQFEMQHGMFTLTLVGNEAAAIPKKVDGLLRTA